ncbi:MAG: homoserine dehydrogenase [Gammaproteobacteria bacterium]|jgi:homoserine dehydrogenase
MKTVLNNGGSPSTIVREKNLYAVKIGICGLGTVGKGTLNVINRNRVEISARAGCEIVVSHIGARRGAEIDGVKVSTDIFAVAEDPEVNILVELIGGTTVAKDLIMLAIANGKHVVTANKALIAEHGNEIFHAAEKQGVCVAFEAAVAGGIPIIKAIREGLAANKIEWLAGIINGTGNFILSEMREKGRDFSDVLQEAQDLGYAEADPTFDVEGVDAAHKLVILASLAFGIPLQFDKVYTEGITKISVQDVDYAEELGYRIKHLGVARKTANGVELRVHPTLIPEQRLIANVNGVMNAILVHGDAVGPTLYYGAGAGAEPTASSVIADIVDIARSLSADPKHRVPYLAFHPHALNDTRILGISEIETAYYLRMLAEDKPGVLSRVAQILSDGGISIEAISQKPPTASADHVPLVILTNRSLESELVAAISKIESLENIEGEVTRIRVESLG